MNITKTRLFLAIIVAWSSLSIAWACQVPVFRYALERWKPDSYRICIVTDGPLDSHQSSWLEPLKELSRGQAPLELELIDVSTSESSLDPILQEALKQTIAPSFGPQVVVTYPKRSTVSGVAHSCPLTSENVSNLIDSPARQEIVRRLTSGDSAVWVLVQSGDPEKDRVALEALQSQLQLEETRLKLPSADELELTAQQLAATRIPLRIGFSVLAVRRDDPEERFLLNSLLNSEPDLHEYSDEPLAFPIFGRGIVLYALVGKGISPETIKTACSFIVGPCSCQVKEQNPGFDLLLSHDWDGALGKQLISSEAAQETTDAPPRLLTIPSGKKKN